MVELDAVCEFEFESSLGLGIDLTQAAFSLNYLKKFSRLRRRLIQVGTGEKVGQSFGERVAESAVDAVRLGRSEVV